MEGKFQTSFIPKKPLTASTQRLTRGISILSLIAALLFSTSIAMAGAVFLYENFLLRDIEGKKASFKKNEEAFNPADVATYSTLNKRIVVAQALLQKHLAPSSIFGIIDEATLKNVRFSDFNLAYVSDKKINLTMKGQAFNYNSVAKQSDVFSENPANQYIHNPIFADLDLDAKGNVIFSFSADIDPQQILYSNHVPLPSENIVPVDTPAPTDQSTTVIPPTQ